jgi:hypothetical protein
MVFKRIRLCSLYFLIILSLAFGVSSCKTTESMPESSDNKITIGSFGGFAGAFKEYTISSDGLISLRARNNGDVRPLSKMEQNTVKQFFSILADLNNDSTTIYNPGNMTYFIRLHRENKENIEWVWGGGDQPVNQIQSIYRTLNKLCRSYENPIK